MNILDIESSLEKAQIEINKFIIPFDVLENQLEIVKEIFFALQDNDQVESDVGEKTWQIARVIKQVVRHQIFKEYSEESTLLLRESADDDNAIQTLQNKVQNLWNELELMMRCVRDSKENKQKNAVTGTSKSTNSKFQSEVGVFPILGLPPEVLQRVFSFLDIGNLMFARVCHHFNDNIKSLRLEGDYLKTTHFLANLKMLRAKEGQATIESFIKALCEIRSNSEELKEVRVMAGQAKQEIVRREVRSNLQYLVPICMLTGAVFTLLALVTLLSNSATARQSNKILGLFGCILLGIGCFIRVGEHIKNTMCPEAVGLTDAVANLAVNMSGFFARKKVFATLPALEPGHPLEILSSSGLEAQVGNVNLVDEEVPLIRNGKR